MHDILIKNGKLIDGTGNPATMKDVAIKNDKIVDVSEPGKAGQASRTIDAAGKIVTPGFVDMHTHYDGQVTWDPYFTPSGWHGCTTVIFGNCGVGFAPAKPDKHDWLIGLMEGVEDIPGAALAEGIKWNWETFPEYMSAIEKYPHAIDFATQVPHGALRAYVMGERGAANEEATPADIGRMYEIVKDALNQGALGFSTSRTELHRSIEGVPVPGTYAVKDELFGIGRALKDTGKGVFQLACEHYKVGEEFLWMKELAAEIKRPVVFNMTQSDQAPELWRELKSMLEDAAKQNIPIYGQVAGRSIGILMNWKITAHPFAAFPSFVKLKKTLSADKLVEELQKPEVKAMILQDTPVELGDFERFVTTSFQKMFPLVDGINYEPSPDESIADVSGKTGKNPLEIAYDAMMQNNGNGMIYFPLFNYSNGDLELLHELHSHPQTRMGLSDGGAHVAAVCDGGMPTFMLTHWTRDRTRGGRLPLEHIIHRQTKATASFYGLLDRGVVAPGYKADLNIIDYENLSFLQPSIVNDLPAGSVRLVQKARGYEATICSGKVIFEKGEATGEMAGKLVRGSQKI